MPGSYDFFKKEIKLHLIYYVQDKESKFLDVGPGYGTYGNLLKPEFNNVDAVEIWEPYVKQFNLESVYKNVYIDNILNFNYSKYDYLILGDVLEHIIKEDAILLIKQINEENKKCLVAVPYLYSQGSHEGNIYETHLQPDITHDIFLNRYENMRCLFRNELYGYYINY
jgi:hypothetical protein